MSEPEKIRYVIALRDSLPVVPADRAKVRRLTCSDADALAALTLDAYVGTIDYKGETLDEALSEIDAWLGSSPLLEHSYAAIVDGEIASAVLVMALVSVPFISIVMTRSDCKDQGFGRLVTATAIASLRAAGEKQAMLYITHGNTPSEKLFLRLGAVPQRY